MQMRVAWSWVGVAIVAVVVAGCEKTKQVRDENTVSRDQNAGSKDQNSVSKEGVMTLTVKSTAFDGGAPIPKKYAYRGVGENISPPLTWSGAPASTKSYAIICDDPDAPSPKNPRPNPYVHWVLYNIPAQRTSLAENETVGVPGKNGWDETSYGGPKPPVGSGTHRYFFHVYALDQVLDLPVGATKDQLLKKMQGHIVAQGELYGTFTRE